MRSEVLVTLREVDRRLTIYPQFGEPVRDLLAVPGTEWIGFAGPLVVRYVLVEESRQVRVVSPITPARRFAPPGG